MNFEKQGKKSLFWGLDPRWAKNFGGSIFFDRPIKNLHFDLNDSRPIPHLKRDFQGHLDGFQEPKKVQRKKVLVYVESLWRANSQANSVQASRPISIFLNLICQILPEGEFIHAQTSSKEFAEKSSYKTSKNLHKWP